MARGIYGTEMSDDELAAYLRQQGSGVLSLVRGDAAYAVPVSFGYDGANDRCVLNLGFTPDSRKRTFIDSTGSASLTVYDRNSPTDWHSAVLGGPLRPLGGDLGEDDADLLDAATSFNAYATEATAALFDEPLLDVEFEWYELRLAERSGRRGPDAAVVADE